MANTYSIDFNRVDDDYAYRADTADLSPTGDHTWETWIKLDELPSTIGSNRHILAKYSSTASQRSYYWRIQSADNKMVFWFTSDGTNTSQFECNTAFDAGDLGVWIHIAVVVDVSVPSATFYINGSPQTTTTESSAATSIQDGSESFLVNGYIPTAVLGIDGHLDELLLFNDIRTEAEIGSDMYKMAGEFTPGVNNFVDGWSFENNYTSVSGNNNLTAGNSPTFVEDVPSWIVASTITVFMSPRTKFF